MKDGAVSCGGQHVLSRVCPRLFARNHVSPGSLRRLTVAPRRLTLALRTGLGSSPCRARWALRALCNRAFWGPGFLLAAPLQCLRGWKVALHTRKAFFYGATGYLVQSSVKLPPNCPVPGCVDFELATKETVGPTYL